MPIKVLDKNIAELIAAGEVVERPASVVKELVENAIDAGATSIEVELKRGGLELIRVTDNGGGIPSAEVPTAFLRHATSKIREADDLDGIETLGFRGEALAAICAVSRVRLVTRTAHTDEATDYRIEGGEAQALDVAGAPCGTSIYVADLFYNTPARMKFLKKDVHEGNAAQNIVEQLALSHPEIAFRLVREGRVAFSTTGRGGLAAAVFCALPREIASNMLEVMPTDARVHVSGLVSKPQFGRPSRSLQFVFVNDRFIKSRSICAAAEEAGRSLVMAGKHLAFVLNIRLPYTDVDINVHPAKTEVRFKNEREVTSCVYAAVKLALHDFATGFAPAGQAAAAATAGYPQQRPPVPAETKPAAATLPVQTKQGTAPFYNEVSGREFRDILDGFGGKNTEKQQYSAVSGRRGIDVEVEPQPAHFAQPTVPYQTAADRPFGMPPTVNTAVGGDRAQPALWETYDTDTNVPQTALSEQPDALTQPAETAEQTVLDAAAPAETPNLRYVGEVLETYIIAQYGAEVLLIDKHAAHERILFETLQESDTGCARQILLEPVIASVSRDEKTAILENPDMLERIGFVVDEFGDNELAVREIPTYMALAAAADAVVQMAAQLTDMSNELTTDDREWLLHSSACRAAIKAGHKSSARELLKLAQDILFSKIPKFCPHGRPVYITLTQKEIEKQFGRA